MKKIHLNPAHKGRLHQALHVAEGEKIRAAKLKQALRSKDPKIREEANFANNAKHWSGR